MFAGTRTFVARESLAEIPHRRTIREKHCANVNAPESVDSGAYARGIRAAVGGN